MAYPITGNKAKITCTTSGTDLAQLFTNAIRDTSASLSWDNGAQDSTPLTAAGITTMESISGLKSGTLDFEGLYPKSGPKLGVTGNVTGGNGYVTRPQRWSIEITCGEEEITGLDNADGASKWRRFMPGGLLSWGGSYTCLAIDSTTVGVPEDANSAGASATFTLCEGGATDPSLSGLIMITGMSHGISIGGKQEVTYTFKGSGALTNTIGSSGTPGLLSATTAAIGIPSWDDSNTGTPSVVMQYFTGRTYTGDAFWTRLGVEVTPAGLVRVRGSLRWDGAVTAA